MRRVPMHRRLAYATAYGLMATAGVCAALWPTRSAGSAPNALNALMLVWAAFLFIGGAASAWGALAGRWLGEYIGLPLLASVFAVYGVAAIARAPDTNMATLAGGFAFLAIAQAFLARWADVAAVRREALQDVPPGGGDG